MLLTDDGTIFWRIGRITGKQAETIPMHGSTVDQMNVSTSVPILCSAQVLRVYRYECRRTC